MNVDHIAIVGLGSIGSRYLRLIKSSYPNIEITLVRSGKGLSYPEEMLADRVVKSINDLTSLGVKTAIISSPATQHIKQASVLVNDGIHTLIEKPLSHSLDGISNLIEFLNGKNVTVLIGYILRHDPVLKKIKSHIDNGLIGEITYVKIDCGSFLPDWRQGRDYKKTVSARKNLGGGVLLELSHELDYLRWLFGEAKSVYAHLTNTGMLEIEVEESADFIIETVKGFSVSVHLDFNRKLSSRKCTVYGTNGEINLDLIKRKISLSMPGEDKKIESFNYERDDLFLSQIEHFFDCIENRKSPKVSVKDAFETMRLIEASRKSNECGRKVHLD